MMNKMIPLLLATNSCIESVDYVSQYDNCLDVLQNCTVGMWLVSIAGKSEAYTRAELLDIVLGYFDSIEKNISLFNSEARVTRLYNGLSDSNNWISDVCEMLMEVEQADSYLYFRNVLSFEKIAFALEGE